MRFLVFVHRKIVDGSSGLKYNRPPVTKVKVQVDSSFQQFLNTICQATKIDPFANRVEIPHRHLTYLAHGTFCYGSISTPYLLQPVRIGTVELYLSHFVLPPSRLQKPGHSSSDVLNTM